MYSETEIPYRFYDNVVAARAQQLISDDREEIIDLFYSRLIANPVTTEFLSHQDVENRLKNSFHEWLTYTFDYLKVLEDPQAFLKYQDNIGRVHSRVNINLSLINYSKVLLKRCLYEVVNAEDELLRYISDVIDYSVDTFNQSYLNALVDTTRHTQTLKAVTSGHQLALDFERAKGEVNTWIRDKLWSRAQTSYSVEPRVEDLNIYHWLKHKGSMVFTDDEIRSTLMNKMTQLQECERLIEKQNSTSKGEERDKLQHYQLKVMMSLTDQISKLLDRTIELILAGEESKDALTKTLSRRYLATIAQKEVRYARQSGKPFSVLMIDIDNFKLINDHFGHRTGDLVLENAAQVLMERVRPGDYVFRYGGEEFLVLITETTGDNAVKVAEKIRSAIENSEHRHSNSETLRYTVSIGVAEYDFHPDFIRTVDQADRFLYVAKNSGKNRTVEQETAVH